MSITERQKKLLKAIIQEFISTAEAVPSLTLSEKYSLPISPATIRNEMKALGEAGYLKQLHTSSGRVPTTIGLRLFIQELMERLEQLELLEQERIRQTIFNNRFSREDLIRQALNALVSFTGTPAIFIVGNKVYYSGLADMLDIPEFQDVEKLKLMLRIIEDYSTLTKIFSRNKSEGRVKILIGEEMGFSSLENFAVVFTEVKLYREPDGYIGVIGPNRMNYARIIPAVEYVANQVTQVTRGW